MAENLQKIIARAHVWYIAIAVTTIAVLISIRAIRSGDFSLYFDLDVYVYYVTHLFNLLLYLLVVAVYCALSLIKR